MDLNSSPPKASFLDGAFGQRHCPKCEAPEDIRQGAPLWPAGWTCGHCRFALAERGGFVQLAPKLDDTNDGFPLEGYGTLQASEDDHFWFSTRNELIEWLIRRFARHAVRVLEIGCGTGYVLFALRQALPRARLAGSELHSQGLVYARRRHGPDLELLQMDARHTGLTETFDLVGAFDVLEHIADDVVVLKEIHRMLKPGGILIATVPQHPWLWSKVDDEAHHQRRYKLGELAAKARTVGLRVRYQTSFATLAFPLMVVDRWRARKAHRPIASELKMSRPINAALKVLFRTEQILRRLRFPLPIGGSQVLVAEKVKEPI